MSLIISNSEDTETSVLSRETSGKILVTGSSVVRGVIESMIREGLFVDKWEKHDGKEILKNLPIDAESPEAIYAIRERMEAMGYSVYEHSEDMETELRQMIATMPERSDIRDVLEVLPEMNFIEQEELLTGLKKIFEAENRKG